MQHYELLWLIVPAVSLFLFVALTSIWWRQRQLQYVRDWSMAYFVGTVGLLVDTSRIFFGDDVSRFANLCFGLVALFTARGLCRRYSEAVATNLLWIIYGVSQIAALGVGIFSLGIVARGSVIGVGMAAMLMVAALSIWQTRDRQPLDVALAAMTSLVAMTIILRPIIILMVEGDHPIGGDIGTTFWITSHKFVGAVSWIGFAILFAARIAVDFIGRLDITSKTDPLTGVLNRRGFDAAIGSKFGNPAEIGQALLMIVDIDHFKTVNDSHGHAVGDAVLQGMARTVIEFLPDDAIVGRMGGEEFAVFLVCARGDARLIADGLRVAIAMHRHSALPSHSSVTASIGATFVTGADSLSESFTSADRALYEAKRNGRNRVVFDFSEAGANLIQANTPNSGFALPIGVPA